MNYDEILVAIPADGIMLEALIALLSERNKALVTPARRAGVIQIEVTALGGFVTKVVR